MALTQISSDGVKDGTVVNADINASAAIAFSKLQDVSATDRILGRDSSGAGDIEEITPANVRTMLNVEDGADVTDSTNVNAAGAVMNSDLATKGQILIGDGSGDPTALSVGTNDHILTADSSEATGVKWAAVSGNPITVADCWRVHSHFGSHTSYTTISANWERADDSAGEGGITSSQMSESSGVFTFPSTGIYYVTFFATASTNV